MNELIRCYENLKDLIGPEIEPFDIVNTVDAYRMYFKPEKVKMLLLAESHVYTSKDDFQTTMNLKRFNLQQSYPNAFVRFVYCLGYGESELLEGKIEKNHGTPDFWKIFYSCSNPVHSKEKFSPILKTTPTEDRIINKIRLLDILKKQGIWLVDASIIGINGKHNPGNDKYKKTLSICWKHYIKNVISKACPENVICIGKQVGKVLGKKVHSLINKEPLVISLPSAHLTKDKKMDLFKTIYAAVNGKCNLRESVSPPGCVSFGHLQQFAKETMPLKKRETIRRKALQWLTTKYGKINEAIYVSRYYTPEISFTGASAWWIQLPRKHYRSDTSGSVHFICQKSAGVNDFYYLRVTCEYLRTNETKLAFVADRASIFLSAEARSLFQDEKGSGRVRFSQFLVNKSIETD